MSTVARPPGLYRAPLSNVSAEAKRANRFPWLLFLVSWLALFLLWNRLDSPITWIDAQDASNLAQNAKEGSIIGRVVIVTLGGLGLYLLATNRKNVKIKRSFAVLLLAYIGWTLLSGTWADDPALAGRRLVSLALMLLFAAGCVVRMSAANLTIFIAGIPTLNLIPGLLSELFYGTFHLFDSESRFVGTAPHPNVQAATLAFGSVLLYWLSWRAHGRTRFAVGCVALVVTAFLADTGSRTALLAVAVALVFSGALIVARDYRRFLPLLLPSLALCFALFSLANLYIEVAAGKSVGVNSLRASRDEGDVTSFNGRLALWRTLLIFARERPIRGYGYGSFWSPKHIDYVSYEQGWAIQQSHSSYIEQVLALGFPGAFLYFVLLLSCLTICTMRFLQNQDSYGGWAAAMLFVAIHNATEAINVGPLFTNFAFNLIVLHIALVPTSTERLSLSQLPRMLRLSTSKVTLLLGDIHQL